MWGHTCKPQKALWPQLVKGYTLPTPPALLPTHDFKAQGHMHFAERDTEAWKGQEPAFRSHSPVVQSPTSLSPCSLFLSPALLPEQGPSHSLALLGSRRA